MNEQYNVYEWETEYIHRGRGCSFIELILSTPLYATTAAVALPPYPTTSHAIRGVYSSSNFTPLPLRKYNHLGPLYIRLWEEDNERGSEYRS